MGVGVTAVLRGDGIAANKTMTGTLNPDGSIGHVSGVAAKIRAAAEAGYTEILIPSVTGDVPDSTTNTTVDPTVLGESVGVTVTKVATVADAYKSLTGHQLLDSEAQAPPLDPTLVSAVDERAHHLAVELRNALASEPTSASTSSATTATTTARACLNSGSQLLAESKAVPAYSTLWLCLRAYKSAVARNLVIAATAKSASESERSRIQNRLARHARSLEAQAKAAATQAPANQNLSPAGVTGSTGSFSWPMWAQAELATYAATLEGKTIQSASSLANYAGSISDAAYNLTTSFPDTQHILQEWPATVFSPLASASSNPDVQFNDAEGVQKYFSGYSSFLKQAADANLAYYETVVAGTTDEDAKRELRAVNDFYDTTANLKNQSADTSVPLLVQLASVSTYYLASSALVSAQSAFGAASTSAAGDVAVGTLDALQASLDTSVSIVNGLSAHSAGAGLDPSYALWQKDWGFDVNKAKSHNQRANEAMTGLIGIWQSTLQLRMLDSLISGQRAA